MFNFIYRRSEFKLLLVRGKSMILLSLLGYVDPDKKKIYIHVRCMYVYRSRDIHIYVDVKLNIHFFW